MSEVIWLALEAVCPSLTLEDLPKGWAQQGGGRGFGPWPGFPAGISLHLGASAWAPLPRADTPGETALWYWPLLGAWGCRKCWVWGSSKQKEGAEGPKSPAWREDHCRGLLVAPAKPQP